MIDLDRIVDELLERELLLLVEDLKKRHIELGQKATGEWIDSLRVEVSDGKGIIWGRNYTEQLVQGREPGALPPIDPLKRWAEVKLGKQGKEALNTAWAVAIKISREGTEIHKQGGTDLLESVITPERIDRIYNEVGKEIVTIIEKDLLRDLVL